MMGCFHIACRYQDPNNARIVTIQGKFTWTCFYFHLTRPDFFHTQRLFKGNCDEIFIYTIWKGILNERDFFINKTVWLTLNIGRRRTRTMHQTNQAGCPESGGCVSVCVWISLPGFLMSIVASPWIVSHLWPSPKNVTLAQLIHL